MAPTKPNTELIVAVSRNCLLGVTGAWQFLHPIFTVAPVHMFGRVFSTRDREREKTEGVGPVVQFLEG